MGWKSSRPTLTRMLSELGQPKPRSPWKLVAALLGGGLLGRGTIAFFLPPGFDEAYYYLYTRHLDWSYFDHPLMVALSTGFGVALTGEVSQFTIRLGALLLHTGALLLLYLTARRLFSEQAAVLTLTIASLVPIFLMGFGVLTLPDSPLIFFWTAALLVASHEFFPPTAYRPSWRLAIIGFLTGLACLSKYHGLALGVGFLGFCLLSPPHRAALRSPWLLAGVGLFLLAIAPIVVWNSQHDWISLRFQSARALPDRGYSFLELLGVFFVGNAYLFPTFGFPLWWAMGRSLLKAAKLKTQSAPALLILCLSLPIVLGFTFLGGYRPILPTWAAPGFWSATLLLGNWAAEWAARSRRRWLVGSGLVIATLLLVGLLHLTIGLLQKPGQSTLGGGLVPVTTDASVQMLDIQQLRRRLADSAIVRSALTQADFVFTSEIFLAGQVGMAIAPLSDRPITCLSEDLRGFAFWSQSQDWVGKTGLFFVSQRLAGATSYTDYFRQIEKIAEVQIDRGGVTVEVIQIYRCEDLLKPYLRPYG